MERLLEILGEVENRLAKIREETWIKLCRVSAWAFLASLGLSIVGGLVIALSWPTGLWIEALFLASTVISLIIACLFGIAANLKQQNK